MALNITEDTFANWAKGPGQTEADQCDNAVRAVRKAIDADKELAALEDISVFPQGSFRARTNVPGDSDVDVCVRYDGAFFADYPEGKTRTDFGNILGGLNFADFKAMLETALVNHFGQAEVRRGDKAFDVRENTYRIDADVVGAYEHRRYPGEKDANGKLRYETGIAFWTDSGRLIKNWPQQNYDNGVQKNDRCQRRYKRTVRIVKRLCYKMQGDSVAAAKDIGSFLIECLVWNVQDKYFASETYTETLRQALAYLLVKTSTDDGCSEWGEVNELKYLFRTSQPWTRSQAHDFLHAAWKYIGF